METSNSTSQSTAVSGGLREVMRQHPLLFFFLMSYAFSWIVSMPYVLSVWGILPGDYIVPFILKPFVGPTLAAIIMTGITEGKAGLRRLRQRLGLWRIGWPWYIFILLGIPTLILLGIVVQPGMLASFQGLTPRVLASYPVYLLVVFFGVALPEEIGWRGFALPRMQPRFGPLWGSILLGVLWGFWHLLYFLTPDHGGGPGTEFMTFLTNFSVFFLMLLALAIIFTWVFNHTRESVFIANLLHASIDTPQLVWVPLFLSIDDAKLNLALLIGFGVTALMIAVLTRGRLDYRPRQEQP